MGLGFRNIRYGRLLWDSLGNYFSLNAKGALSIMYQFCAACLQPLNPVFQAYVTFRNQMWLVAQCQWQIGQLTNVLNMIYDPIQRRITITQSSISTTQAQTFEYAAILQASDFGSPAKAQGRSFTDTANISLVTFNVPPGIDLSAVTATINQIRIQGIPYQIVVT